MKQPINNKQPSEGVGAAQDIPPEYVELATTLSGKSVFIDEHLCYVNGIPFPDGGHPAQFQDIFKSKDGTITARVYYNGVRSYPIQHVRHDRGVVKITRAAGKVSGTINNKIIIECEGVDGKPCGEKREILMSDVHHVKRCKNCQKLYNKLATKKRMKELRAIRRANAPTQEETSRRDGQDVYRERSGDPG